MEISIIITSVLGSTVLASAISVLGSIITKKMDKKSTQTIAINSMMRTEIKAICRQKIEQGFVGLDELEDLVAMHEAYKENGGNGFCTELMNKVKCLPIK